MERITADVLICGDSLGGCAAAMQLGRTGLRVVMLREHAWIGGQMTSQLVPPDEHPWIESFGRTELYAQYRDRVRSHYRQMPLRESAVADQFLNPGKGWVSRLCHEPGIGARVLEAMVKENGRPIMLPGPALRAEVAGDRITAVETATHRIEADYVLDATELGDILELAGAESVVGAESRRDTGEPHALEGDPEPRCQQGITWCAVFGWDPSDSHVIDKPADYERWRAFVPPSWPGPLLSFDFPDVQTGVTRRLPLFDDPDFNLFNYRQIVAPEIWKEAKLAATVVNWPQNDLLIGSLLLGAAEREKTRHDARQLTLSLLYWLQTEAGYPGLFLDPLLAGTGDGLAQAPYIRESRRAITVKRLTELDVSAEANPGRDRMAVREDSVAVGCYRLDLHPRINGRPTIDVSALPYQVPLGCLVPVRIQNLIPACKNFGVTHVANGCTRLHPTEWAVGEAAGILAACCLREKTLPLAIESDSDERSRLQSEMVAQGLQLDWPDGVELRAV